MENQKTFDSVRNQHRAFFMRMALEGMRWHLYAMPCGSLCIFREDAIFDVPCPIVAFDVHCMDEARLMQVVHNIIRGL